jgi:hypothetical protein
MNAATRAGNNRHRKAMWLCRCDCGTERVVNGRDLRKGHSKSCGMANRLTTAAGRALSPCAYARPR